MLRVGLVFDSDKIPGWVAEIITTLSACPDILLVVRIYSGHSVDPQKSMDLFKRLDSVLWPNKREYSEKKIQPFAGLPEIKPASLPEKEFITFSDNDLVALKKYQPELLLYFGANPLNGDQWGWLKYGLWSIGFGDSNVLADPYAGFWEWYHRKPLTKISLLKFDGGALRFEKLHELSARTINLSYVRNQNSILSKAIVLMTEEVIKLAGSTTGGHAFDNNTIRKVGKPTQPGFMKIASSLVRLFFRSAKKIVKDSVFDMGWVIFFDIHSEQTPSLNFKKFKALVPSRDRFWADPFVISRNGRHYIFMEEFLWSTDKGHITCLVIDENGNLVESKIILDKPYHLSYPFIFEDRGVLYMIPESTDNKTIDLFECVAFPFEWHFKKTLLSNIHAVDTTVHFQDNRFWLFCGTKQRLSSTVYDELQIFYSNDLLTDNWTPHPKNPVVSDIKTARPAGAIFKHEGFLCRPAQIGVPDYGYGLSLNRITELNEENFSEEIYQTIIPNWRKGVSSVHTLNFSQGMTVTDGVLKRFRKFH